MKEQAERTQPESQQATQGVEPQAFEMTGHSGVDHALEELEQGMDQPVDHHAGLYQHAHDQLTAVLDAPVDAGSPDQGD